MPTIRLLLAAAVLSLPAWAWNHVGHKAVAGAAYDRLNKQARARVDALIRQHPDYASWVANAPAGDRERARFAFIQAAFWPDMIKGDVRFWDEARRDAVATPAVPGFADMKRRQNWHYINVAFSPDGTPFPPPPPVNVLSQIQVILGVIGSSPAPAPGSVAAEQDPTYLLPWLLHLVGDVHNPMHCTSRWKKDQVNPANGQPWSDLGGNGVYVLGAYNLHALWDDAMGITDSPVYIEGLIKALRKKGEKGSEQLDPVVWVQEGAELAKTFAYSFGNEHGSKENPIKLPDAYVMKAKEISRERAALAGRRLAAVLNQRLGSR